jgi:hypothetical protein
MKDGNAESSAFALIMPLCYKKVTSRENKTFSYQGNPVQHYPTCRWFHCGQAPHESNLHSTCWHVPAETNTGPQNPEKHAINIAYFKTAAENGGNITVLIENKTF